MIPVAILCGGKGTRMRGGEETVPKPLVEIGGKPILWHVMSIYAAHGLTRFVLLCGNGAGQIEAFAESLTDWDVTCLDTGVDTPTGGRVDGFREKPRLDSWVNGGFMVMEPRALDSIGPDDVLERRPLEQMAGAGELYAFRHEGFWDCMDTYKDTLLLNELWAQGRAPWRTLVEAEG